MKILEPELELVVDAKNHLGETPIWSKRDDSLYWVNCEKPPELHRWNSKSGEHRIWPMPERIGGFVLKESGGALVVLAHGLYDMDLESGRLTKRIDSPMTKASLHECHCDRQGRFWVGGIADGLAIGNMPGGAALYRLDGGRLVEMVPDVSCSNGLAFGPEGRTLYHSNSPTGVVDAWDLDPATGDISNKRVLFTLQPGEGFCDGSTVDGEGGYWASIVFGSVLRRYLPDGSLDMEVKLPFDAPTKVAFGGPDLETMFITTTNIMSPDSPMLGGLYAFKPGVRGVPEAMLPE